MGPSADPCHQLNPTTAPKQGPRQNVQHRHWYDDQAGPGHRCEDKLTIASRLPTELVRRVESSHRGVWRGFTCTLDNAVARESRKTG